MTDAYAETDVWPNPPATPTPAPERTETAPDASRVLGDVPTATDARGARYGEVINHLFAVSPEQMRDLVDAVVTVADAEQADLRAEVERERGANERVWRWFETDAAALRTRAEAAEAERDTYREQWHQEVENFERETVRAEAAEAEVERLKRGGAELGRILERTLTDALNASGRHDAIEEDGDGDWGVVWETLAELRPRAERAEAERDALRAEMVSLADEWENRPHPEGAEGSQDWVYRMHASSLGSILRAALARLAPAVSDGEGATSEAIPVVAAAPVCETCKGSGATPEDWSVQGRPRRPCPECGGMGRPASPVVAPSATEAPQAPTEQEGRCECGHRFERHSNLGCLVEVGNAGTGSVADAVFCRCTKPTPSPRPDTADDEGVRRG